MCKISLIILIKLIYFTTTQNIDEKPDGNDIIFDSNNLTCLKLNQTYFDISNATDDHVHAYADISSAEDIHQNLFNFDGKTTVLFRVTPMPQYEDEVALFQNLYDRFTNTGYKNINFTIITTSEGITDNIRGIVNNITVFKDTSRNDNRTLFNMKPLQVYVIDSCGRITYIIEPPWSFIEFPYVKAAILSTIYDLPCDHCDIAQPFLEMHIPEMNENDNSSNIEVINNNQSDFKSNINVEDDMAELVNEYLREKQFSLTDPDPFSYDNNIIDFQDESISGDDELINLLTPLPNNMNANNETMLDNSNFVIPIKITIPMEHVHYYVENDTFVKYNYVVLKTDDESYHQHLTSDSGEILYELSVNNESITVNKSVNIEYIENMLNITDLRQKLMNKSINLNNTQIYVNEKNGEMYEKMKHHHLNDNVFDELSLIEIDIQKYRTQHPKQSNREAETNADDNGANPKIKNNRFRSQKDIAKHYDQLLQWLTWQFN